MKFLTVLSQTFFSLYNKSYTNERNILNKSCFIGQNKQFIAIITFNLSTNIVIHVYIFLVNHTTK